MIRQFVPICTIHIMIVFVRVQGVPIAHPTRHGVRATPGMKRRSRAHVIVIRVLKRHHTVAQLGIMVRPPMAHRGVHHARLRRGITRQPARRAVHQLHRVIYRRVQYHGRTVLGPMCVVKILIMQIKNPRKRGFLISVQSAEFIRLRFAAPR